MIQFDLSQILLGLAVLLAIVVGLFVLAESAEVVRRALAAIVHLLLIPVEEAQKGTAQATSWLQQHTRTLFRDAVKTEDDLWPGWAVIGAFFFASLVLANLYAEVWLLVLSLPLLGFMSGAFPEATHITALAALAIISLGLYYGGTLTDAAAITKIGVWHNRPRWERMTIGAISLVGICGVLLFFFNLAQLRAEHQTQAGTVNVAAAEQLDPYAAGGTGGSASFDEPEFVEVSASTEALRAAEERMIVESNVLLAVLGALVLITGKWSLLWALAYLLGIAMAILWGFAWCVDFLLRVTALILRALRDQLVPDLTELAHHFVAALRDALDRVRETIFDRNREPLHAVAEEPFEGYAPQGGTMGTAPQRVAEPAGAQDYEVTQLELG